MIYDRWPQRMCRDKWDNRGENLERGARGQNRAHIIATALNARGQALFTWSRRKMEIRHLFPWAPLCTVGHFGQLGNLEYTDRCLTAAVVTHNDPLTSYWWWWSNGWGRNLDRRLNLGFTWWRSRRFNGRAGHCAGCAGGGLLAS